MYDYSKILVAARGEVNPLNSSLGAPTVYWERLRNGDDSRCP